MNYLMVLYDPDCGLCRRAQGWLLSQQKFMELVFVPAKSEEARRRFPVLNHGLTLTDLTVISNTGEVYTGAKAWLLCLWACRQYRSWAVRLATPALLPTVKSVVSSISENRYKISKLSQAIQSS
jgi:predicted DCC family thiol-disulfide oxidoreductase YuxK